MNYGRDEKHEKAEKPTVRSGDAPARVKHQGEVYDVVRSMACNDWVLATHVRAKSIADAARRLGGAAMRWRTSEVFSCVKMLSAPWMD